jgi:hypothetical protein
VQKKERMSSSDEELIKLLPALKEELKEAADDVSDEILLRYLHWKPNAKRAADRFRLFQKWHNDNLWAHTNLKLTQDDTKLKKHILDNIIIAPETLVTKDGCNVLVGRLRNNDLSDGRTPEEVCRMIFYIMDRVLERQSAQENGVVIFHDMKGVSKNNVNSGIPKLLLKAIIGTFPLKIKGIYLLNAPFFVKPIFSVISTLMFSKKLKERVHYVNSLDDIYEVIDKDLLLVEHGGKLEFDSKAWVDKQIERETNSDFSSILV